MDELFPEGRPRLVLAPMQDVTDLVFMRVVDQFGGPDYFVTEYFRVHRDYTLEKKILRSITENETGKPVFAQMIGLDLEALNRNAKELMRYPVAGVDLNLGCPAPAVYRKNAGGGLLRDLDLVDRILGGLRDAIDGRFTVKTRVGFESPEEWDKILDVFAKHEIDILTVHGRTVKEKYETPVHWDLVKQAVDTMSCPVVANGNVVNVATGRAYYDKTEAAGLMIGRGAIRSPWLFQQIRDSYEGRDSVMPTRRDLHSYARQLYGELARDRGRDYEPSKHVNRMKKYMIYISQGVDAEFEFLIRRVKTEKEFMKLCDEFMLNDTLLPDAPPVESKLFSGYMGLLES